MQLEAFALGPSLLWSLVTPPCTMAPGSSPTSWRQPYGTGLGSTLAAPLPLEKPLPLRLVICAMGMIQTLTRLL